MEITGHRDWVGRGLPVATPFLRAVHPFRPPPLQGVGACDVDGAVRQSLLSAHQDLGCPLRLKLDRISQSLLQPSGLCD